jgi:hypothetical protein
LHGEVERVAGAKLGGRNITLNRAAFCIGTLHYLGHTDADLVADALFKAAQRAGLDQDDGGPEAIWKTIYSGFSAGLEHPREFPEGFGHAANGQENATDETGTPEASAANDLILIPCSELRNTPPDEQWLLQGYIARNNVTVYSALFKVGKTTFLAHLLRAAAQDGTFVGLPVKNCRILYITEEHESRWADRRDKLGLKDHITFIVRPFARKPTMAEWVAFLGRLRRVQEEHQYDLIIFDTLSNLWPVKDENSATEVQAALMPLHGVIGDAALLMVHHLRKSDGAEGTGTRGSGALHAWIDILMEMRRYNPQDHGDRRRVITAMGRFEETPAELVVKLTAEGYVCEGEGKATVQGKELILALLSILTTTTPGKTFEQILEDWPGSVGPNHGHLRGVIKKGLDDGLWVREGDGTRGSPYRYRKPAPTPPKEEQPAPPTDQENGFSANSRPSSAGRESGDSDSPGVPPADSTSVQDKPPQNNSHSRPTLGSAENVNSSNPSTVPPVCADVTPETGLTSAPADPKNGDFGFSANSRPNMIGREYVADAPVPELAEDEGLL